MKGNFKNGANGLIYWYSPSHTDRNSWMYSSTNTNLAYPSSDDKAHLKSKWGY